MKNENKIPEDALKMIEEEAATYYKFSGIGNKFKTMHELGFNRGATFAYKTFAEPMKERVEELEKWKKEAIEATPPMQEIGKAIGVKPGHFIHDKILPYIESAQQQISLLQKEVESYKSLINSLSEDLLSKTTEIERLRGNGTR